MVGGRVLITNSTHVKANANQHQYTKEQVLQNTKDYMDGLNEAVKEERRKHGKKRYNPERK
ncbi:hypothetical protein WG8_5204 [Paenibacillus sp. Aloe-11]|nr:hypothetical protein WG8_5204 [Paenibacillus sp. Aloe-11]